MKEPDLDALAPEDIVRYLEEARMGAMEAKQYSTAVRAAELLGKHLGMFNKKQEEGGCMVVQWAGGEPAE